MKPFDENRKTNKMTTTPYNEYKITLSSDISSYGDNVSQARTNKINKILSAMISRKFPEIQIEITPMYNACKTTGPDYDTIDEINSWISENLTAAL
jgi:hypothetical protein